MKLKHIIYVGRCLPTNKVYVGSSRNGKRRPLNHILDLNKQRHSNTYLQRAWNKYGENKFVWHIVEICSEAELKERETWWIGFMRALDRRYGYNLCNPVGFTSEVTSELAKTQVKQWKDPVIAKARLVGLKKVHKDPKWQHRRKSDMTKRWQDPKWRAKMLRVLAKNTKKMSRRSKTEPGFKERRMRGIQPKKYHGRV